MRMALTVFVVLGALAVVSMWPDTRALEILSLPRTQVVREPIASTIPATGFVSSRIQVDISAPLAGRLVETHVKTGDRVKSGQILARLDDRETRELLEKASAQLKLREHELALAQSTLARLERTAYVGFVSPQHLEDLQTQVEVARAQRGVARADLKLASARLEDLVIRTPVAGLISESNAQVGEWTGRIDATAIFNPKVLFRIIDPDALFVFARIDEADLAQISLGQPVLIDSESSRRKQLSGRVGAISPVLHEHNGRRVALIEISLDDAAHGLLDGSQVDLSIVVAERTSALSLPFGAIERVSPGEANIVVLRGDQPVRLRISTGLESLSKVEILGDSLQEGESVLMTTDGSAFKWIEPR